MSGRLYIVGLGPGDTRWLTPEAQEVLALAQDIIGYAPYVERVPKRLGQNRLASDNRVELDRAREALERVDAGRIVAVVSGGDPGVFAMAAAVFEAVDAGAPHWRDLDIRVMPEKRLEHAARGDFVIALYNPASRARPTRIADAFGLLKRFLPGDTLVSLAKSVGREKEEIILTTLDTVDPMQVDMSTLVMIGASGTKRITREDGRDWIYTARAAP